jgi:hypothetical protein
MNKSLLSKLDIYQWGLFFNNSTIVTSGSGPFRMALFFY